MGVPKGGPHPAGGARKAGGKGVWGVKGAGGDFLGEVLETWGIPAWLGGVQWALIPIYLYTSIDNVWV